jgi:hypothetical protein
MSHFRQEPDTCQCTAIGDNGKRRTMKGTHDNGAGVLCTRHHQKYLVKKANDQPIVRKK